MGISAILKHSDSTDDNANHVDFPTSDDTWCGYKKISSSCLHKNPLPETVMNKIYQETLHCSLCSQKSFGLAQNAVESLNSVVWGRCPKEIFVRTVKVQLAIDSAVPQYMIALYKLLESWRNWEYHQTNMP